MLIPTDEEYKNRVNTRRKNREINPEEQNYLELGEEILNDGLDKDDRTGVGTLNLFVRSLRFNLSDGKIPLMTYRKLSFKNVVEEFLFMVRGEVQTKLLEEKNVNIWKLNTSRKFLDDKGLQHFPEGLMGRMYGFNYRNLGGKLNESINTGFDQLKYIVNLLKTDPNSRRITMTSQDFSAREDSVLDCCHGVLIHFSANPKTKKLDLAVTCRSSDFILGLAINIPFYALMLILIAKITGFEPNELIMSFNDVHLYNNHIEKFKEKVLTRNIYPFPKLNIKKDINSIEDIEQLQFEDFELINYQHNSGLIFEMAV